MAAGGCCGEGKLFFFKGVAVGKLPMLKKAAVMELSGFIFLKRRMQKCEGHVLRGMGK